MRCWILPQPGKGPLRISSRLFVSLLSCSTPTLTSTRTKLLPMSSKPDPNCREGYPLFLSTETHSPTSTKKQQSCTRNINHQQPTTCYNTETANNNRPTMPPPLQFYLPIMYEDRKQEQGPCFRLNKNPIMQLSSISHLNQKKTNDILTLRLNLRLTRTETLFCSMLTWG